MAGIWHKSLINIVKKAKDCGLVLYGAGFWGEIAFDLFDIFHVRPNCFCDDDIKKIGRRYCGVDVFSLKEAVDRYPKAIYIVCVDETQITEKWDWERKNRSRMLKSLKKYGVYNADSEIHIMYYVFLLDVGLDLVKQDVSEASRDVSKEFFEEDINKIILFNHMSNSGAYFLEQLLDGHSDILCLPYIESLEQVYTRRLQFLEGEELLIEMTAQMLGFLHSKYEDIGCVGQHRFGNLCLDKDGNFIKDVYIDPKEFIIKLKCQFGDKIKLNSYGQMLKIYFAAYNNCLKKCKEEGKKYWIFYHMHLSNYDVSKMFNNLNKEEFERIENLMIIREPVQHCYSWFKRYGLNWKKNTVMKKGWIYDVLRSEMGCMLEKREGIENVRAIRFEDLKYNPEGTLMGLCKWLQLEFQETLLNTTLNGEKIYWPVNTPNGIHYITGFDTSAVGQVKFVDVLSLWDEARLNMMYAKFKRAYNYTNDVPDILEFDSSSTEKILEKDFKFADIAESVLMERSDPEEQYPVNEFVKDVFREYINTHKRKVEYYEYIRPIKKET